jgi:hypothetical protein
MHLLLLTVSLVLLAVDVSLQEEIVNACGVDDIHDGVNYVRTACVIAVSKSKEIFEPLIHQVGDPCYNAHGAVCNILMLLWRPTTD